VGALPDWYATTRMARLLGIPPWEVEAHPEGLYWGHRMLAAESAERHAETAQQRRQALRQKIGQR